MTTITIRRGSLALALLLLGLGGATASARTTLRWKFKPGDVMHYSMDQTTVSTGEDPDGKEVKQTFGLILDMTWKVKEVDASGVATLTQTIDRVRTSAVLPFGKFSSDSKDAGDGVAAGPLLKMLVGAEFTSKMTPIGEQTEITLSEKLLATLRSENAPAGAMGQFSEPGLKNMIAQMVIPLSEAALDPGQSWTRKIAIPSGPSGQTRQIEQTFTYKGPDPGAGGLNAIDFSTKFEPLKPDPAVPVTLKKESATGRYDFDSNAGRISRSNVVEVVEVSISLQGKEVPQKVDTTRTLTLSKDKAP